mmetsp:Transcript_70438/g.124109  ORF Transcript_70438/g.124109 Transcript_70438/m.124109 type:complete len:110 (+) Transcript_70438:328-657(+)
MGVQQPGLASAKVTLGFGCPLGGFCSALADLLRVWVGIGWPFGPTWGRPASTQLRHAKVYRKPGQQEALPAMHRLLLCPHFPPVPCYFQRQAWPQAVPLPSNGGSPGSV